MQNCKAKHPFPNNGFTGKRYKIKTDYVSCYSYLWLKSAFVVIFCVFGSCFRTKQSTLSHFVLVFCLLIILFPSVSSYLYFRVFVCLLQLLFCFLLLSLFFGGDSCCLFVCYCCCFCCFLFLFLSQNRSKTVELRYNTIQLYCSRMGIRLAAQKSQLI